MKTADEQLNLLAQGCESVVTREELKKKLEQGRPLRVKLGWRSDCARFASRPASVVLRKLRQFQEPWPQGRLDHRRLYRARGRPDRPEQDATGMLSEADIERNAKTYFEQAGKIWRRPRQVGDPPQ